MSHTDFIRRAYPLRAARTPPEQSHRVRSEATAASHFDHAAQSQGGNGKLKKRGEQLK
jgi:hypothetical protein